MKVLNLGELVAREVVRRAPELQDAIVVFQPERLRGGVYNQTFRMIFLGKCSICERPNMPLVRTPGMTAYQFEGSIGSAEDPNRDRWFCQDCSDMWVRDWQDQWEEYRRSVL